MQISDWISVTGIASGVTVFVVGLLQYGKAQRWERSEFVAAETKATFADKRVQVALFMLDWNQKNYDLSVDTKNDQHRNVIVTDDDLQQAMVPHSEKPQGFSETEVAIRNCFDELLSSIQRFEHFVEAGLVTHKDFDPYMRYWLAILGNRDSGRKPRILVETLWKYIEFYGLFDVQSFFKRFGYDIRPRQSLSTRHA